MSAIDDEKIVEDGGGWAGTCYCNSVSFRIRSDCVPHISLYCHCESCRRAHAAPLYHVVYVKEDDIEWIKGAGTLSHFRKNAEDPKVPTRVFCSICGSRMMNILHNKPWYGFFPATLRDDVQHNLPDVFKPTMHYCGQEAVLDLDTLDKDLPVVGNETLPA
jgi:hypothetical protein